MSDIPQPHQWRFFRSGGFDQVELATGEDLRNLASLDPKLWTVLNCPTTGLEFDSRTAALLDADGDGQIRVPEVLAAAEWVCARLVDPDIMFQAPGVPASAISDTDETGQALKAAALRALQYVGKSADDELQVADLLDMTRLFSPNHFNGDGVITAHLTDDEGLQTLINEIRETQGSVVDRSGEDGVNADLISAFYKQLDDLLAWRESAAASDSTLYPLGDDTATAAGILDQLEAKVNDYFVRCRLASFDERASDHLNPAVTVYDTLGDRSLNAADADLGSLPLATIVAGRALPLTDGVNPAWADLVGQLRDKVITPLLGDKEELNSDDWQTVLARLAPYREWLAARPDTKLLELDVERLTAIKTQQRHKELLALVDEDLAAKSFADTVDDVERLVRYQRDLVTLLQNFVTMSDFYRGKRKAIFQIGTLYIDQRSCELVLRVDSVDRHTAMAPFSGCYLIYCTCERQGEAPINIVAALTGGGVNELMVPGRNGVYYDRRGRDWKATVTRVVEQPVSLRQAFWAPYQRAAAFVEAQLHKFAASRDQNIGEKAAAGAADTSTATQAFDIARFAGIFAAIGLAIGAIGTALAAALAALFSLQWWQMPLVFIGLMLVISGPSVVMAYLTLRNRNLGPLLDANGWAVNTRARINVPFGAALTGVAELPAGSRRLLRDPYADTQKPWKAWLFFAAVIAAGAAIWYWLWPLLGA